MSSGRNLPSGNGSNSAPGNADANANTDAAANAGANTNPSGVDIPASSTNATNAAAATNANPNPSDADIAAAAAAANANANAMVRDAWNRIVVSSGPNDGIITRAPADWSPESSDNEGPSYTAGLKSISSKDPYVFVPVRDKQPKNDNTRTPTCRKNDDWKRDQDRHEPPTA